MGEPYEIDDIILAEYGNAVVGLEMLRSLNEESAEEIRKMQIVKSAISTLSASELDAVQHIFEEMQGNEGILVASKVADRVGITRSVIVECAAQAGECRRDRISFFRYEGNLHQDSERVDSG